MPISDEIRNLRVMYCWACCHFGLAESMGDFVGFYRGKG